MLRKKKHLFACHSFSCASIPSSRLTSLRNRIKEERGNLYQPQSALYIGRHASALDTGAVFHTTRMQGLYTSQNEHFTYTRISRPADGFGILVVTCLHTSNERMQILCASCIRILYNAPTDLHTKDRQDRFTRLNPHIEELHVTSRASYITKYVTINMRCVGTR